MPEHLRLRQFGQLGRLLPAHGFGQGRQDIPNLVPDSIFDLGDKDAPLSFTAQFKDDRFIPPGLVKSSQVWLSVRVPVLADILLSHFT